jgi:hypothetical protein
MNDEIKSIPPRVRDEIEKDIHASEVARTVFVIVGIAGLLPFLFGGLRWWTLILGIVGVGCLFIAKVFHSGAEKFKKYIADRDDRTTVK